MTPFERDIERERARLLATERAAASQVARTYKTVLRRLRSRLGGLTRQIDEARTAGVEVRPAWLFGQRRYRDLIDNLEVEMIDWMRSTHGSILAGQAEATAAAAEAAPRLAVSSVGPGPSAARRSLLARSPQLDESALRQFIGRARDGRPLAGLLAEIAPAGVEAVRDTLAYGVASGQGPRVIAAEVVKASDTTLARALTVTRTEVIGSYRDATQASYQRSPIVTGWTWHADIGNGRTCPACLAMHGTHHPDSATLDSHPNCRCSMVPRTPSWAELGFDGTPDQRPAISTGAELLDRMPDADKLAILGQRRLDAYNAGQITLDDLVRDTHSQRWGHGRRAATLQELGV